MCSIRSKMLLFILVFLQIIGKCYTNVDGFELSKPIEHIELTCVNGSTLLSNTSNISSKDLYLVDCSISNISYLEFLTAHKVTVSVIKHLGIIETENSESDVINSLNVKNFEGFASLQKLSIINRRRNKRIELEHLDYLISLTNVTYLYTYGVNLQKLPQKTHLKNIELNIGTTIGELGGCRDLEELYLIKWDIRNVPERWLAHCPKLTKLVMREIVGLEHEDLRRALLDADELRDLEVTFSNFTDNDKFSNSINLTNLRRVDFSSNNIGFTMLPDWPELVEIEARHNSLRQDAFLSFLGWHKNLTSLDMSYNNLLDVCSKNSFLVSRYGKLNVEHSKVKNIFMNHSTNTEMCFAKLIALEYMDVRNSSIAELEFFGVPVSGAPRSIIDLRSNPVEAVLFTEMDYENLRNGTYTMESNKGTLPLHVIRGVTEIRTDDLKLDCDCKHGWFGRALHNIPRLVFNATVLCKGGNETHLIDTMPEQLECNKSICVASCTCRRYWSNNATDVICPAGNLTDIPNVDDLRALIISKNLIKTFNAINLPNTLTMLDISHNRIPRLEANTTTALFSVRNRRVRLSGNPIVCNCKNQEFLQVLQTYHLQIDDYKNVTCAENSKLLSELDVDSLCESQARVGLSAGIGVVGGLLALTALCGAVYCRYERELRVFLYSRGWCLWCVQEEELDADRKYDVFISFSHGDEEFVVEELVPGLEKAPHVYKVCVHYRDWMPGEFIPLQISRSVENSRRTIVVMSKKYLASMWGLLEFRTAHEDTLRSGHPRIIVILKEDVREEAGLDPELLAYLKNNTYVKWKDPWFWEKLRFALPHRSSDAVVTLSKSTSSPKQNTSNSVNNMAMLQTN